MFKVRGYGERIAGISLKSPSYSILLFLVCRKISCFIRIIGYLPFAYDRMNNSGILFPEFFRLFCLFTCSGHFIQLLLVRRKPLVISERYDVSLFRMIERFHAMLLLGRQKSLTSSALKLNYLLLFFQNANLGTR